MPPRLSNHQQALEAFRRLRRRADLEQVAARLAGRSALLLPFHEVHRLLQISGNGERELDEIRLDAIVGSVGRYHDFDRRFLPLRDSDAARWAAVALAFETPHLVPPIDVYRIASSYFVADGNHRVSVARYLGLTTLSASVTTLTPRIAPIGELTEHSLLLAAELTEFCVRTNLDRSRSAERLRVSNLGAAADLYADLIRYRDAQLPDADLSDAAVSWYDEAFTPTCELIERRGLLARQSHLTAADRYLWLCEQRTELQQRLGWQLDESAVAAALERREPRIDQLLDLILPPALEPSTHSGSWRRDREVSVEDWLFRTVLVPIAGDGADWRALDQALLLARDEETTVLGLHAVTVAAERELPQVRRLCEEFHARCTAAGIRSDWAVEVGPAGHLMRERSHWCDLLILPLNHPPGASPLARLTSRLRTLIRGSRCPVLVLPAGTQTTFQHLLVAYDGSARADEALVLGAYLAARRTARLSVAATADDPGHAAGLLAQAESQLAALGVRATCYAGRGDAADGLVLRAEAIGADVIVLGGYGGRGALDLVLGSVTEALLRISRTPLLICQ